MSDTDTELDDLVRRVDPDRWLSSRFIADPVARADVVALYALDHELARAPKVASNALLGEIRLTWWREMLEEAFEGRPVRHHPTAQALAAAVARRSLPRASLEAMIDGRYRELDWARDVGGQTAALAVEILDPAADAAFALAAGSAWALRHKSREAPELTGCFTQALATARTAARYLSAAAFPAVAHLALAGHPQGSDLGKRARLTLAVARGRI